jgi:ketosteroid isomerase-like protein
MSEELVRRWFDALNARNHSARIEMAHPDIEVYPMQFAVSGTYNGHEGLRQWGKDLSAWDPGHHVEPGEIRELGDGRYVAFGTVIIDGEAFSPYALLIRIADGKVVAVRSYLNDEETLERMGVFG